MLVSALYSIRNLSFIADLTFGRDAAQYWQLVAFLAIVSIVLWVAVVITTIIRVSAGLILNRRHRAGNASNARGIGADV